MRAALAAFLLFASMLPCTAQAQTGPPGMGEASDKVVLRSGTSVRLMLLDSLSSKTAQAGSAVRLQVVGDVRADNLLVIANGAPASATVERAIPARRAWRAGYLVLRLDAVTLVNQQQEPLRGSIPVKGGPTHALEDWAAAAVQTYLLALVLVPFAPLQHGNEAVINQGAVLEAAIARDVVLPRGVIEGLQPAPAEPRHRPASITFYYPGVPYGSVSVWCGRVRIGNLHPGGRFTVNLPDGRYWVATSPSPKRPSIGIDVEEDTDVFVGVTAGGQLALVPPELGAAQSALADPAKANGVVDVAAFDLALLQSDRRITEFEPPVPRALARGKVEIAGTVGMYGISSAEDGVSYEPSTRGMFGANAGVGITSHIALRFGFDMAAYRNDTYYRPEQPQNPYLATARIFSGWSGVRYEFRNPLAVTRPFVGGGVLAAKFTNVERGPKDVCTGEECRAIAPELFDGTRVTGYFDAGLNFMPHRAWGVTFGVKVYPLKGDETDATTRVARLPGDPTGHDYFFHTQAYAGFVYRRH